MLNSKSYLDLMVPWLNVLPQFLRRSQFNPRLRYYGTGESLHWPTQSNLNVFAALAVLGTSPELPESGLPMSRQEIIDTALDLLRYALATHVTGPDLASDGQRWGHHWISVLGVERMAHGLDAIRGHLTDEDHDALRRMMVSESDWRLDQYEIVAGMVGAEGRNKPESNIWNGGVLLRTALEYPDTPRAQEYLDKATRFLLNGLSHPLDAACETRFRGQPVRKWHVGFNYTPNWSLDHHGYLNVGYMVICLSNLAMLHFFYKRRGLTPPPELYWHVREVWEMVKKCTFADGRLLRIGGDTRARYTYCQDYAIPSWMLAEDFLGDEDAASFEAGWLKVVQQDMDFTGDGGYYGGRLANIRDTSYFYFARLESDAILCLSYGACWRRLHDLPQPKSETPANPPVAWQDEFHGATLDRSGHAIRSFVWHGGQGPTGVIAPARDSSLAEWQGNLRGELVSTQTPMLSQGASQWHEIYPGGFLNAGVSVWRDWSPVGEGEAAYDYARHHLAVAALPDSSTMLVLEYAVSTVEVTLKAIKGYGVKIPNDVFNGRKRYYQTPGGQAMVTESTPGHEETRRLKTDRVGIDGQLAVIAIYGAEDGLVLHRPADRTIVIKKNWGPWLHSLYVDEVCGKLVLGHQRVLPGAVLLDGGFAIALRQDLAGPQVKQIPQPGLLRAVEFSADGKTYLFAANFGGEPAAVNLPATYRRRLAGRELLAPDTAALWVR
ncbi:MAG: hypothetical protein PHC30_01135 [Lentisphaeria bacterium]|nr:hypothetical protein [Lentisphaeria bacterium]